MSSIITKTLKNNSLEIWGDGSEKRDFLYIDDFLDGINLLFLEKEKL